MPFPAGLLVAFSIGLAVAAGFDVRRRRIPNALTALLAASGLCAQVVLGGWTALLSGLGAALLLIAVLFVPWMRGRIGGGDVKLAAAAAAWSGFQLLPPYLLAAALAGGVIGIICYALSARTARQAMVQNLIDSAATRTVPDVSIQKRPGRVSVPYGAAVALGAFYALVCGGRF